MKKKILAVIAFFVIAFIGGYLFKEPKADAANIRTIDRMHSTDITYQVVNINGTDVAVFTDGRSITAVKL